MDFLKGHKINLKIGRAGMKPAPIMGVGSKDCRFVRELSQRNEGVLQPALYKIQWFFQYKIKLLLLYSSFCKAMLRKSKVPAKMRNSRTES